MQQIEPWLPVLRDLGALTAALAIGWVAYRLLFRTLVRWFPQEKRPLAARIIGKMRPGARLLLPAIVARAGTLSFSHLPELSREIIEHGLLLLGIAGVTWLLTGVAGAVASFVRSTHDVSAADNLEARRVHTQVNVLERTVDVLIVVLGVGAALMSFPEVRRLGTGIFASAGVVGLVVGLAARPLLENLIAGIQLALTQPIRVDDVVIVHGEWGRIEEITTTYVVVRIWDERRLVVPFSSFIGQAFENWTRTSAEILGTIFLWTDYRVPVDEARKALEAIVHEAELWDERVCNVQVVDITEHAVKLRALVSAADSGKAWDLRVHVRERWLAWLQENHPDALPRSRVLLAGGGQAANGGEASPA